MEICERDEYHPRYYHADRVGLLQRLIELQLTYTNLGTRKTRRDRRVAATQFSTILSADIGDLTVSDLDNRDNTISGFDYIFDVWEQNGSMISNAAEGLGICLDTLPAGFPLIPKDIRHHIYFHMGKHPRLALTNLPGEFVEGVYVSSAIPRGDDPLVFLMAVTRRGGPINAEDTLRKRYLNQSSIVVSGFLGGEIDETHGEREMIGDPAVELAMRAALHLYVDSWSRSDRYFRLAKSSFRRLVACTSSVGRIDRNF